MFFITKGQVGVGYTYFMNNAINQRRTHIPLVLGKFDYLCEHAVLFDLKAQFYYEARTDVWAFALDKTHLILTIQETQSIQVLTDFKTRARERHERL